jgi:hypothetical protein
MIGDRNQLLAVDHGNTFVMVQAAKPGMAVLAISQWQKTEAMQDLAQASCDRDIGRAFKILGERVIVAGEDFLAVAAQRWLALSVDDRETGTRSHWFTMRLIGSMWSLPGLR